MTNSKGLNKALLELLKKGKAQEADALLQGMEANAGKPLTHNPLEALKDVKIKEPAKPNFELVGQPQDKGFVLGESGPISRPPVPYKPSVKGGLPSVVEPEVVNLDLNKSLQVAGPAVDGKIIDVSPVVSKWEKYKKALKIGGAGLGVAGGAALLAGGGESAPESAEAKPTEQPNAAKTPEIKEPENEIEKALKKQMASLQARAPKVSPSANSEPPQVINFGDSSIANAVDLKAVQDKAHIMNSLANFRESSDGIAYDIAGIQRPQGVNWGAGAAGMRKQADSMVGNFKDKVAFEKEDPNSAQSKGYRELAKSMGFDIQGAASAADIERQLPQLANIYNQKEAQKARAHENELNRQNQLDMLKLKLAEAQELKKNASTDKRERLIKSMREELVGGANKDLYNAWQKSDVAAQRIHDAIVNPSGYKDLGNLYGYLKSLDDQSAVREGELALGLKQGSIPERMQSSFKQFLTGEMVSPSQRRKMADVIIGYANQNRNNYLTAVKDTLKQAKRLGMSEEELMSLPSNNPYALPIDPATKKVIGPDKASVTTSVAPPAKTVRPEDVDNLSDKEVERMLKERGF